MAESPAFIPPPRRIDDILYVLDQPGQFETLITEKFKAQADAKPPDTEDRRTLKGFYRDRGGAAFELNRYRQARDDLQKALAYKLWMDKTDGFIKCRLGIIESLYGNFQKSIALYEDSSTYPAQIILSSNTESSPIRAYLELVILYTTIGDLDAAKSAKQSAVNYRDRVSRYVNAEGSFLHEIMLQTMDVLIQEAQGSYAEAESECRKIKSLGLGPAGRLVIQ